MIDVFQPAQIPVESQPYWMPSMFASELIKRNAVALQAGLSLTLSYPSKDASANTLNIAEIPYKNMQLGQYIVEQYCKDNNLTLQNKKSNWVLLLHLMLEQSVWYLECSSEKFKQKCIATRNLALANALVGSPIKNFPLFNSVLSFDYAYFDSIAQTQPQYAELVKNLKQVMAVLEQSSYAVAQEIIDWLAGTFQTTKDVIKTFVSAYALFRKDNIPGECIESKCSYLKLTADDKGNLRLPKRFTGTKYAVAMDTVMMPLHFMRQQAQFISDKLKQGIIFVSFKRDNDIVRDMIASCNDAVLQAVYGSIAPAASPEYTESRGYIRCVDICCSAVGGDCFRAISLARILGIKIIQPDLANIAEQLKEYGFHPSFAKTDLNRVVPTFKEYIGKINTNLAFLTMIYKGINPTAGTEVAFTSPYHAEFSINQYVDMQASLTSSFVRKLHLFMLNNPMLFPGYTGAPEDCTDFKFVSSSSFTTLGRA